MAPRLIYICCLLLLAGGCAERQRRNPLDWAARNPQDSYTPLAALAGDGEVRLRWDYSRFEDIDALRLYRRVGEGDFALHPVSPLQPGELRIKKGGEEIDIAVSGGFVEMFQNKLTVLADAAERADEIDVERAEKAMARAQERIKSGGSDADLAVALAAIRRSQLRMKVAERRRRRGGGGAPSPQA